ncbi:MAG: glutamine amidotransferase [Micrococcales bacterium]|nr:glutamine amidotransferase [Micrococcales bacterium]
MSSTTSRLAMVQLFPGLMGTYGDGGNLTVLQHRARARGLATDLVTVGPEDAIPAGADIYVLGGGEDAGQVVAAERLIASPGLRQAHAAGATIFAVCAGLQILGQSFEITGGQITAGLGILDVTTRRRQVRAIGEILTEPVADLDLPFLTGYENHGGGTSLGPDARPLAKVTNGVGNGSGGPAGDGWEGAVQGNILASYLHGPVLARNPALADYLIAQAAGLELAPLEAPFVEELRAERVAYVKSGRLSAEAASAAPRRRLPT